jgi:hypothetical protein
MEQLHYNLLYRWFVGLGVDDPVWVPTVFTKNRNRLLDAEVAHKFLAMGVAVPVPARSETNTRRVRRVTSLITDQKPTPFLKLIWPNGLSALLAQLRLRFTVARFVGKQCSDLILIRCERSANICDRRQTLSPPGRCDARKVRSAK